MQDADAARIDAILDLARWAPSGDNTQPWRFEVAGPDRIVVHAFDTRRHCLYDRDGAASQLAVGAMLETMRIAASSHGCTLDIARRSKADNERPLFDVHLINAPQLAVDPLVGVIRDRSVQRRPLRTRPLSDAEVRDLEDSIGSDHGVVWWKGWRGRARMAWLAARSAKIRLTTPEAHAVHASIIEWGASHSVDRVPDQALGASRASLRLMRWALASWPRVERLNRYAAGTVAPRIELDLIPGLLCARHFAIVAARPPSCIDDNVAAGAVVQRFWLTATRLGLQLQPQYTPLVFAAYARSGTSFTVVDAARSRATQVGEALQAMLPTPAENVIFLGRIGHGPAAMARSTRLSLSRLRWNPHEIFFG